MDIYYNTQTYKLQYCCYLLSSVKLPKNKQLNYGYELFDKLH